MNARLLSPLQAASLRWLVRGLSIEQIASLEGRSASEIATSVNEALRVYGETHSTKAPEVLGWLKCSDNQK